MKVKKFTASAADLQTLDFVELDLMYTDSLGYKYLPNAIEFQNSSGTSIEFLYISDDNEKKEIDYIPLYFEYLDLLASRSVIDLPKTRYIRLRVKSGTTTPVGDVVFFAYNFVTWN